MHRTLTTAADPQPDLVDHDEVCDEKLVSVGSLFLDFFSFCGFLHQRSKSTCIGLIAALSHPSPLFRFFGLNPFSLDYYL